MCDYVVSIVFVSVLSSKIIYTSRHSHEFTTTYLRCLPYPVSRHVGNFLLDFIIDVISVQSIHLDPRSSNYPGPRKRRDMSLSMDMPRRRAVLRVRARKYKRRSVCRRRDATVRRLRCHRRCGLFIE